MSEIIYTKETGIKEIENKVSYSEIYWSFIEQMAIRMNDNKEKYGTHNYRKPLQNKDELLDAALRHLIKIIEPLPEDIETKEQHIAAVSCNLMMFLYQKNMYDTIK